MPSDQCLGRGLGRGIRGLCADGRPMANKPTHGGDLRMFSSLVLFMFGALQFYRPRRRATTAATAAAAAATATAAWTPAHQRLPPDARRHRARLLPDGTTATRRCAAAWLAAPRSACAQRLRNCSRPSTRCPCPRISARWRAAFAIGTLRSSAGRVASIALRTILSVRDRRLAPSGAPLSRSTLCARSAPSRRRRPRHAPASTAARARLASRLASLPRYCSRLPAWYFFVKVLPRRTAPGRACCRALGL